MANRGGHGLRPRSTVGRAHGKHHARQPFEVHVADGKFWYWCPFTTQSCKNKPWSWARCASEGDPEHRSVRAPRRERKPRVKPYDFPLGGGFLVERSGMEQGKTLQCERLCARAHGAHR